MRTRPFATIVLLIAFAMVPLTVDGALPRGEPVKGSGATAVISTPFVFEGVATMTIGGVPAEATVITALLGPPRTGEDGTLLATTSHTFVFSGGSFTTIDRAVLDPTGVPGVFTLNSSLLITSGDGEFADVEGRLHVHGQITLTPDPLLFGSSSFWQSAAPSDKFRITPEIVSCAARCNASRRAWQGVALCAMWSDGPALRIICSWLDRI